MIPSAPALFNWGINRFTVFSSMTTSTVGASYRALHQSDKALAVYQRGLKQSPRNEIFAAGEIRCLDDLGRYDEGEEQRQGLHCKIWLSP